MASIARFSFKQIFWITGGIAFCLSPIADNLTTALLMATVIMAVAGDNRAYAEGPLPK